MTETITTYQASNIETLAARTGRDWTEFADVPAGTLVTDLPKTTGIKVLKALLDAAGVTPAAPLPVSRGAMTGQTGRCLGCGTDLDRLAAGGYCHDCQ